MKRQALLLLCMLLPVIIFSQTSGKVIDKETNEPIIGAKISCSSGEKTLTDLNGGFQLNASKTPFTLFVSMATYKTDSMIVTKDTTLVISLELELKKIFQKQLNSTPNHQIIFVLLVIFVYLFVMNMELELELHYLILIMY